MAKASDINGLVSDMRQQLISEKEAIEAKLTMLDELIAKAAGMVEAKPAKKEAAAPAAKETAKAPKITRAKRGSNAEIGKKIYDIIAAAPDKKCKKSAFESLCADQAPSKYINAWNNAKGNETKKITITGSKTDADYSVA